MRYNRRMGEGRGATAIHGAQLGVLGVSLIVATIFLVFVPDTWVEAESTMRKGPVDAPQVRKASPGVHEAGTSLFPGVEAHRPGASPVPKTVGGEDRARRLGSPTFEAAEENLPPEGRRGEGRPLETAPSPPLGNCDDPLALVDQRHPLPRDYVAGDLVPLGHHGIRTLRGDAALRRGAAEGLARLMEAAEAAGEDLVVASAYRSFSEQQAIHAELSALYGEEAARISARPGHSEHQLGTTVDFTNAGAEYGVWSAFEETSAYRWLREHARDYGFVQSYRRGKEKETGYEAESWHYRYVGAENARRLEVTDLSLRAFLLREGVVPRCEQ